MAIKINNDRLIVAAPELLQACKLAYEQIKWVPGNGQPGTAATAVSDFLTDAIIKAEGEWR